MLVDVCAQLDGQPSHEPRAPILVGSGYLEPEPTLQAPSRIHEYPGLHREIPKLFLPRLLRVIVLEVEVGNYVEHSGSGFVTPRCSIFVAILRTLVILRIDTTIDVRHVCRMGSQVQDIIDEDILVVVEVPIGTKARRYRVSSLFDDVNGLSSTVMLRSGKSRFASSSCSNSLSAKANNPASSACASIFLVSRVLLTRPPLTEPCNSAR
jgi:hypothetical protein